MSKSIERGQNANPAFKSFANGYEYKLPNDQGTMVFIPPDKKGRSRLYRKLTEIYPDKTVKIDYHPDITFVEALAKQAHENREGYDFTESLDEKLQKLREEKPKT